MSQGGVSLAPLLMNWRAIAFAGALGMVCAVLLSFVQPLEYSSTTRLLITQELGAVDAYTASRSAERIADDLAAVVYTSTFYDKVMSSGYPIVESYFPDDALKRRDMWEDAVAVSVSRSSGLLTVRAFHPDVSQAEEMARAVAYVLSTQGWTYTSGGNISVQIVDEPLNSRYPVRPNLVVNGLSGLVLGLLAGAGYVMIMTERYARRHQITHEDNGG